jgi:hypothetical protein
VSRYKLYQLGIFLAPATISPVLEPANLSIMLKAIVVTIMAEIAALMAKGLD